MNLFGGFELLCSFTSNQDSKDNMLVQAQVIAGQTNKSLVVPQVKSFC